MKEEEDLRPSSTSQWRWRELHINYTLVVNDSTEAKKHEVKKLKPICRREKRTFV